MTTVTARFQVRRGTAAGMTTANPVLAVGEPCFEIDTGFLKIGDGTTAWVDLNYVNSGGTGGSGDTYTVTSQAAMLALTAAKGDMVVRTDNHRTYRLRTTPASTLANWVELVASSAVTTVATRAGDVVLTKADVGLPNVEDYTAASLPLSDAADDALLGKQDYIPTYATLTAAQAAVTAGVLTDGELCVIVDPTT